jgi:hypothetical protein
LPVTDQTVLAAKFAAHRLAEAQYLQAALKVSPTPTVAVSAMAWVEASGMAEAAGTAK